MLQELCPTNGTVFINCCSQNYLVKLIYKPLGDFDKKFDNIIFQADFSY